MNIEPQTDRVATEFPEFAKYSKSFIPSNRQDWMLDDLAKGKFQLHESPDALLTTAAVLGMKMGFAKDYREVNTPENNIQLGILSDLQISSASVFVMGPAMIEVSRPGIGGARETMLCPAGVILASPGNRTGVGIFDVSNLLNGIGRVAVTGELEGSFNPHLPDKFGGDSRSERLLKLGEHGEDLNIIQFEGATGETVRVMFHRSVPVKSGHTYPTGSSYMQIDGFSHLGFEGINLNNYEFKEMRTALQRNRGGVPGFGNAWANMMVSGDEKLLVAVDSGGEYRQDARVIHLMSRSGDDLYQKIRDVILPSNPGLKFHEHLLKIEQDQETKVVTIPVENIGEFHRVMACLGKVFQEIDLKDQCL